MNKLLTLAVLALSIVSCGEEKTVEWTSSNPSASWQTNQVILKPETAGSDSVVQIFPDKTQQVVEGFGGCFNELGWEVFKSISSEEKNKIFTALFDSISGCKFTICRMPMGASDYAVDWYSLNETKDDFGMEHFSLERDRQRMIPYIKTALTYQPALKVWASPWCPPSWMKTNNHYACTPAPVNDLAEEGRGEEMKAQFRMEEKYLSAYALYFSKFVQSYKQEGIDIYAVHVQNEPNSCQNFPSCIWTPSALATFTGKYLGPQFERDHLNTEIWLGTIERPQIERVDSIVCDPDAKKYIKGVGFQWGGKGAIAEVHRKYPEYKLMETESECGNGSNDWAAAEHTFGLMKHYLNNGANVYMYWNMILNETGNSQWGWKQNSLITIDSKSGVVTYNPEFYLMKHFSYFVKPGAVKIETSDENCLAFKDNGSLTIVYYNPGQATQKDFSVQNMHFSVTLPEKSFNTFQVKI